MPRLENPRHEAFAQYLSEGCSADEAHQKAGYKPNRGNAVRLKAKESVQTRLAELQERAQRQHDVTVHSLTTMYMEAAQMARQNGKSEALSKAADSLAKLHGLWVDRSENTNVNYAVTDEPQMAPDQWQREFAGKSSEVH